eukprot:TRINITY_DN8068_c0_g1_i1.p1 TRINITY_DN8068_c0_g1~~TRINITY_DN8068_c0_g1_i1.p1  ORF type:complete len:690 (+),score=247.15 TRINITY_DN8068_c0_g1_i1:45-2114(+)
MPPKKKGEKAASAKRRKDEESEEEEEEPKTSVRRSKRNAKKVEESESESEEEVPKKGRSKSQPAKVKKGAKAEPKKRGKSSSRMVIEDDEDEEEEEESEEEEKPSKKSKKAPAKKSNGKKKKKKKESEEEEDEEEDEEESEEEVKPKKGSKAAAKKGASKKKKEEDEEEKDDENSKSKKAPAKKEAAKKEAAKKESAKEEKKDGAEETKMVKAVQKGKAVVDQFYPQKDKFHVYYTNAKVYDATLNQSNVQANNNKFYIVQVLQSDSNPNLFYVWNRWGRVGAPGSNATHGPYNNAEAAIRQYEDKVYDKTVKGNYRQLEINYDEGPTEEDTQRLKDKAFETSKLSKPVKELVSLIFDLKMMQNTMKEIGYDAKKLPLGKISMTVIKKGFEILGELGEAIKENRRSKIEALSSDFYSYIPHDFGRQHMSAFIIDTNEKLKKKLELLESLREINVATKILEEADKNDENLIDSNYEKLKCVVTPVEAETAEYKLVEQYVRNTHATTHSNYGVDILDVFSLKREGEDDKFKDVGNRMLLWHGSRLTNYVGIISQGLRIAPPEAPVTGYMFGKGVYFADMFSKSANYCFTTRDNPTGLILLCEVALGETNDLYFADYHANLLPPGKSSTKGCGKTAPPVNTWVEDSNGCKIPLGKGEPTNVDRGALLYNEYIVYDVAQVKMRYLIKLKFKYN